MSLILSTTSGKSHLLHLIDTPGHVNFVDEVASAIRLVDGIVLVVDVIEGVGGSVYNLSLRPNVFLYSSWSVPKQSSGMLFKKASKSPSSLIKLTD
jgi:translation elongation factor EF-1alpha